VRESERNVEVHHGSQLIARHAPAVRNHQVITADAHHCGIPLGNRTESGKTLIHIRQQAPTVEHRPLAAYEAIAGGAR
jgi:hypothetical protein